MSRKLVLCVNRNMTMEHLLDASTKKTPCGLKWKKGRPPPRYVWIPMALFFRGSAKCKVCFRHPDVPDYLKPIKKIRSKKFREKYRTKCR